MQVPQSARTAFRRENLTLCTSSIRGCRASVEETTPSWREIPRGVACNQYEAYIRCDRLRIMCRYARTRLELSCKRQSAGIGGATQSSSAHVSHIAQSFSKARTAKAGFYFVQRYFG